MSKIAYISCPMTVSQAVLDQAHKKVSEAHVRSIAWTKDTPYNEEDYKKIIQNCDVFIVILPGLAWRFQFDQMTSGSRKELLIAFNASIPIYLFYKSREEYGIYAVDIQTRDLPSGNKVPISICGIASTKYNFKNIFDTTYTSQEESKAIDNIYAGVDFAESKELRDQYKVSKLAQGYSRIPNRMPQQGLSDADIAKFLEIQRQTGIVVINKSESMGVVEYKPDNRILLFF